MPVALIEPRTAHMAFALYEFTLKVSLLLHKGPVESLIPRPFSHIAFETHSRNHASLAGLLDRNS